MLPQASGIREQQFSTMRESNELKNLEQNYENAILALNRLQSNFSVLKDSIAKKHQNENKHISDTIKYLERVDISLDMLDKLPAIHISGTKGKGSTCAMVESILRASGYRTGFFSSPHLVSVTERIRLNGIPMSKNLFSEHFWRIYNAISASRDHINDVPSYFCFLTILAFDVFLREKVDVCVIEVGIGGRYDCTNVLRKTSTIGISSLGLEHTKLLGSTLEDIAWQKAGIIKPGSEVFTVIQPSQCIAVIEKECRKMQSKLHITPSQLAEYQWNPKHMILTNTSKVFELNTSLAIQIATNWIQKTCPKFQPKPETMVISKEIAYGINNCFWPGRLQQISQDSSKTLYLDGAHTVESIVICGDWFRSQSDSKHKRLLIFNTTGERDSSQLLSTLSRMIQFDAAFFVPNVPSSAGVWADAINHNFPLELQLQRCKQNCAIWVDTLKNMHAYVHDSIESVFEQIERETLHVEEPCDILITGSIHLIGATFTALKLEKYVYPSTLQNPQNIPS
ncbi:folylpolyglutamate synthase, mitochondrial [Anopheles nili]|uniref:folylpolyglutamate synthase, mitochondrial n=1 Tax=Anopheles nili TaxID=185578 RepID=UPI00237ACBE0|nr:folylpolyglutamate synthase, mitochondrial [Anopheles nili]